MMERTETFCNSQQNRKDSRSSILSCWESAVRRIFFAVSLVLVAAAGVGYYLWFGRAPAAPSPPPVPEALTDPPARKIVEQKRQAVLAAPKSGTAWGELGMAFDAHEVGAEAMTCYRRAMDLDA